MALSGSVDFSVDRDTLIKGALRLIGVGTTGETPSNEDIADAAEALNMMIKAWQAFGLQLWVRKSQSITLTAGKSSYTLGQSGADVTMDRPLRILDATRKDSGNIEIPMIKLTKSEYREVPNKSETGPPHSYYYDPQLTNGVLYLWLTPGTTEATEYTVEIDYHKPFDDVDIGTNDLEFPQEWYEAIKYGLAVRLAPEYSLPFQERKALRIEAKIAFDDVLNFDVDDGSIFFQPDVNYMGWDK